MEFKLCDFDKKSASGCTSNQYRAEVFRLAISDYFGRNKSITAGMKGPQWCRKHYQTVSYQDESWQKHKPHLIIRTLEQTQAALTAAGKSNLTYKIELHRRDDKRVCDVMKLRTPGNEPDPELDVTEKTHKRPTHFETIYHISTNYCDKNQSMDDCKALIQWATTDYETRLLAFKNDHPDAKNMDTLLKQKGPKFAEFQLLPEWSSVYTDQELKAIEQDNSTSTLRRGANTNSAAAFSPSTTAKRLRERIDLKEEDKKMDEEAKAASGQAEAEAEAETNDDDEAERSPSKKPRI